MASGASWIADPLNTPGYEMSGAEGGWVSEQPNNLIRSYWMQVLPKLGYTGPLTVQQNFDQETTDILSPQALAAIAEFQKQGYDIVRNPQRTDVGSKGITEYGLRLPSGELAGTWERKEGAWYEQIAPYLGLVLPAVLGIAGTKLGVTGTAAGTGAVTVGDTLNAIGSNITGTSNELLNRAVGAAVVNGAKELIASGGDAEAAIKGAVQAGALAGAAGIAEPYIQKAADALSQLTGDQVAQLADVADTADVGALDTAGNVGDVEVSQGEYFDKPFYGDELLSPMNIDVDYASLSDYGRTVYDAEIALGSTPEMAYIRAARANAMYFPETGNALAAKATAPATAPVNALTGTAITPEVADAMLENNLTTPTTVAPPSGVATVDLTGTQAPYDPYTGLAENFPTTTPPIIPPTTTAGLGAAGTAAGVAGAGAAAAGAAGAGTAAGTTAGAGGQMTAADLEGLDPNLTLGGGTDVMGSTDVTGGTGAIVTGAAGGAGAGAITAGGAAAAGLTGIPVVDDFLKYLGTPAGAAALGAFGSLAGGYLTGQAAKDAAQIQADAAANALKLQREQFEYQKELLDPYRRRGESALNRLAGVMGLDGQPAQPQQLLEMDPGYAFRLGEGMKALERVQAARGNMLSGGAIKAGQRYAQDFASGEYGNAYNRLANIAGLGQTVGGQLGTAAQQFGQTAGETMSQGANALAAGRINRTSGYMGGIGGAVGAYQNYQNQQQQNQLFGKFLDIYGRAVGAGG